MSDKAFVTLLTKISYLPGTLVLAKDLNCVQSKYPLVVMVTPQLPAEAGDVLLRRGIIVRVVESLQPMEGGHTLAAHDTRFADTWTKLRYSCLGLFFFLQILVTFLSGGLNSSNITYIGQAFSHFVRAEIPLKAHRSSRL